MKKLHRSVNELNLTAPKRQDGFSLIELLVAMVIFLIITGAIYGLMEIGRIDRNRASRRADIQKNARVAVHLIGRDALNAGLSFHRAGAVTPDDFVSTLLEVPPDVDDERDLLTSIVAGNNVYTNNINPDTSTRTDSISFAFRDMDFNPDTALPADEQVGRLVMLQNVTNPSGSPETPRVRTLAANGAAVARPFHLYLVESDTTQVAVMATNVQGTNQIDAATGDPLGLNQPLNGSGAEGSVLRQCIDQNDENCTTYVASMKRFFLVQYRVNPDGTLVRRVFGNNVGAAAADQIQEQPLAYNVQDMQIEYVLKDGTVTPTPNAGPDGIVGTVDDFTEGFNMIRQITVRISVQSSENDERTGLPEVITLNATFATRNMEYDAG
ncbi:MAG: prepilin-type N-terminal cleavage/methylation domain-containing protein [Acidobacteria bacterium]|nr:prepilin-type N-terminal cleavage/methylation domain-containing protein [Acidobacteriota bacterium]